MFYEYDTVSYLFIKYYFSTLTVTDFVRFVYGKPFENDEETETIEIPIVREHLNMKYFIPADEVMISANKITDKILYLLLVN